MKRTENNSSDFRITQRGRLGEQYVCEYLKNEDFQIIQTNYKTRYGEIDIIAEKDNLIVFVEVKTRTKNSFTAGLESITKSKIKKVVKTALIYLTENNIVKQPRLDCAE
ncbi:MAG: YraN family protein, partial [Clostridia bacterium]|nr:YraN family protein [Clostridia bacterium]